MLHYYCVIAAQSLWRNWGLTLLMVLTIGCGVAASMTTLSVYRAMSGNPMPEKAETLFFPQIDVWGPQHGASGEPQTALTYFDSAAFDKAGRAAKQSAIYAVSVAILPESPDGHPLNVGGYAVDSDFFPMLDVPFMYGGRWTKDDDENANPVIVLSEKLNRQVFEGADSTGRPLVVDGKTFTVAGVIRKWDPRPRFFDISGSGAFSRLDNDAFIPFSTSVDSGISNSGSMACIPKPNSPTDGCVWISYMVELGSPAAVNDYRNYLLDYAREQERSGRFSWGPNTRLRNLNEWLNYRRVVPTDTKASLALSIGLFVLCLVSTASLLLIAFLARGSEVGILRALGATRGAICCQFLTEAALVGVLGGILGLLLTNGALSMATLVLPRKIADLNLVDVPLLLAATSIAILSTILAGLYPALKASGVQPAWQLKAN